MKYSSTVKPPKMDDRVFVRLLNQVQKAGFRVSLDECIIFYNCRMPESTNIKPILRLCYEYGFVRQAELMD